jgi:fluoride exporter
MSSVVENKDGDGVRHNRLRGLQADNSYRNLTIFVGSSIVKDFLAISVAAIVGANLRYLLSRLAAREFGPVFPYGTLAINIVGSFIVGFFVIWTSERVLVDPRWRLLVVVGFCGSFTTFSSYAFESMSYFEQGQWGLMLANVLSNNLLCLGGALAGMALARAL